MRTINMSMRVFFVVSQFVLMIVYVVLAYSLYAGVIRISVENAEAYHRDSLKKITDALEIQTENLSRFAASLCYDTNYNAGNQGPEDLWMYKDILEDLQVYSVLNELDSRFTVFLGMKGTGLSSHDNVIRMTPSLMDPLYDRDRQWLIDDTPGQEQLTYFIVHDGEFPSRQVSVLVAVDYEPLRKQLEGLNIRNQGIAFLKDSRGNIMFSRDTPFA
ncbi:MAG: hypothetical protein KAU31_10170, partial [Spirochaetaceae bacterium]|nr:hypothetical protein [Spirochaetaceae bacterium]